MSDYDYDRDRDDRGYDDRDRHDDRGDDRRNDTRDEPTRYEDVRIEDNADRGRHRSSGRQEARYSRDDRRGDRGAFGQARQFLAKAAEKEDEQPGMGKEYGLERQTMENEIASMMTNGALLAGFAFAGFTSVSHADLQVHNSATAGAFSILATLTIATSLLVVFLMSTLHLKLNWDYRLRPREDHWYCNQFYETFSVEFDVAYYCLNATILGFLMMVAALGWVKLQSAQFTNTIIVCTFIGGLVFWFFRMKAKWDSDEFNRAATLPLEVKEEEEWRVTSPTV